MLIKKIISSYLFFLLIFATFSILPKFANASPLTWYNTYNVLTSRIGFIKFSSSINSTVYAAADQNGLYDLLKSSDNGQTWTSIKGNLPNTGDITWISDISNNSKLIVIGLWGSGFYLTDDGGITWKKIYNTGTPKTIEINPSNQDVIYIGMLGSQGVFRTTDGGNNWSQVTEIGNTNVAQIEFDRSNTNRLFIGTDPAFYKSDDFGLNWTVLPLSKAFGDSIIIDNTNSSIIYTAHFDSDEGVYKSIDNGVSWTWLLGGPKGKVYRLSQDLDDTLYASVIFSNPNGGIWKGTNVGETWENVQDPSWGDRNTWGIDAKNGIVVAGVEGLGIFVASNSATPSPTPTPTQTPTPTPSPTPVPGPHPIVVIPGFGGSFSTKGLLLHQPTSYRDWTMMPFQAPSIYNPFLNALGKLNYLRNDKVFFFAYDFTKTIGVSGAWLNEYLDNEVLTKNPGQKVDIVGHSMGGLVARYCFEQVPTCKDKINKIVTAGTPHKGAVADYAFWEGGDLSSLDPLGKFGAELYFGLNGGGNKTQAIQLGMPGAHDFMPIHDYIVGKPYSSLSSVGKNPVLFNLPLSLDFSSRTLALSGNKPKATDSELTVKPTKPKDLANGIWIDGDPKVSKKDVGDGTVLASSSNVSGAINKNYKLEHIEYLNSKQPVADILQFLGLSLIGPIAFAEPASVNLYYSTDPNVEIQTNKEVGEETVNPDPNVLFVKGGKTKQKDLLVKSMKDGDFEIKGWHYDATGTKDLKPVKTKLLKGVLKKLTTQF